MTKRREGNYQKGIGDEQFGTMREHLTNPRNASWYDESRASPQSIAVERRIGIEPTQFHPQAEVSDDSEAEVDEGQEADAGAVEVGPESPRGVAGEEGGEPIAGGGPDDTGRDDLVRGAPDAQLAAPAVDGLMTEQVMAASAAWRAGQNKMNDEANRRYMASQLANAPASEHDLEEKWTYRDGILKAIKFVEGSAAHHFLTKREPEAMLLRSVAEEMRRRLM